MDKFFDVIYANLREFAEWTVVGIIVAAQVGLMLAGLTYMGYVIYKLVELLK